MFKVLLFKFQIYKNIILKKKKLKKLTATNDNLWFRRSVPRPFDAGFSTTIENSWNSVRFSENWTVAETKGKSEPNSEDGTSEHAGFGQDRYGHEVTQEDASEEQIAQFPPRRHDERCAVVAHKNDEDKHRGRHTERTEHERYNSPRTVPRQMLSGNLGASRMIAIRRETSIARYASVVKRVTVFTTRYAAPTTLILFFFF